MRSPIQFIITAAIALCLLIPVFSHARELSGMMGNQEIRVSTTMFQGAEYVPATQLAGYFRLAFRFDSLSGTLHFTRADGVAVGMKVDDNRIVVGNQVQVTRDFIIRRDARFYIPFGTVQTFLFPRVEFREVEVTPGGVASLGLDSGQPVFSYPTYSGVPTATPTPYSFEPLAYPSPTPLSPPAGINALTAPSSVIVLDPGNDPKNRGIVTSLVVVEESLTLAICRKVQQLLQETSGFKVLITRSGMETGAISNEQRIGIANSNNASLFVSVQCGGMFSADASRAAVYFMNPQMDVKPEPDAARQVAFGNLVPWRDAYRSSYMESFRLANAVNESLRLFYMQSRIIQTDENPRPARMAILRGLTMPGIVVELGNLRHEGTAQHLSYGRMQDDLAAHLERGITNFLYSRAGIPKR